MNILSEEETIDLVAEGRSIARYGEGELRYAVKKWSIKSQVYDPRLAVELLKALKEPAGTLIALPRLWKGMPSERFWRQFSDDMYTRHYWEDSYGSAFVSRPDMARNIDTPEYWDKVRSLWAGKDVVLVGPSTKAMPVPEAASSRFVQAPIINAYAEIDRIEKDVGEPEGPVLISLGATATALVNRLARKGLWALDLGHLWHFMSSAGAYSMDRNELISDAYLEQNRLLHKTGKFGTSGHKMMSDVYAYAMHLKADGLLDYGCGQGTLKQALLKAGYKKYIGEYDPAVKGKNAPPKPVDLVVSTDVLEHIEPEKLDAVLKHIYTLAKRAAYFYIATRPAIKRLPDGRNAHLIQKPPAWWVTQVERPGFKIERTEIVPDHSVKFWCVK